MSAYAAGKPFLFAKQAKELSTEADKMNQETFIMDMKEKLERAILKSISDGLEDAVVPVPTGAEPKLVNALVNVLRKIGYGASVQHYGGAYHVFITWK